MMLLSQRVESRALVTCTRMKFQNTNFIEFRPNFFDFKVKTLLLIVVRVLIWPNRRYGVY